ncbi:hypothetical protein MVEN_02444000 [Mycena venus]|uniref:Uncharacterized protein n=1 Tax=Mycena venus TaxID=2733690 RepID=A0A8H6WYI1_9AGAR|nr:hypothetical protein MVEN_02444000 [Mycena venus]
MDAVVVPSVESLGIKRPRTIGVPISTKSVGIKRERDAGDESSSKPQIKKVKKLEQSEGGTLHTRLMSAGTSTEPYPIDLDADIKNVLFDDTLCAFIMEETLGKLSPPIAKKWYTETGHRYFYVSESDTKPGRTNETWGSRAIPQSSWATRERVHCELDIENLQGFDATRHEP